MSEAATSCQLPDATSLKASTLACHRWRRQRRQPVPEMPRAFEEAAALRCYAAGSISRRHNHTLELVLQLPPAQRAEALAELRAATIDAEMKAEGKCHRCMMQLDFCICAAIENIRHDMLHGLACLTLRFVVWIHHKERRRASNTGKIIQLLFPDSTDILIQGVAKDEARLQELLQGEAFVIFPSEDAQTVLEAVNLPPSHVSAQTRPPVAILIDGTWNQAQRMHKHFQALRHVKLSPDGKSSFHWRRQSQEGRISTVEAAALLLENLGEASSGRPAALYEGLKVLMDALGRQCHHDTLFAHELPEPTGKKKHALGAKKIQKELPGQRGSEAARKDLVRWETLRYCSVFRSGEGVFSEALLHR